MWCSGTLVLKKRHGAGDGRQGLPRERGARGHYSREILKLNPDGVLLSNGPGDPAVNSPSSGNSKSSRKPACPLRHLLGHH
jgi:hypothetical protein